MDDELDILMERYEKIVKEMHLSIETIEQIKIDSQRIEDIHLFLQRFNSLGELINHINTIQDRLFYLKDALTTHEAAQYLGIKVSTLYKKTMNHEIPFYSPCSKRLYFKRQELEQWMLQNRHASNEEMQAEATLSDLTNIHSPKRNKRQAKKNQVLYDKKRTLRPH